MIATLNGRTRSRESSVSRAGPPTRALPLPHAGRRADGARLARPAIALTLALVLLSGCQTHPVTDAPPRGGPAREDSTQATTRPPPAPTGDASATAAQTPDGLPAGLDLWAAMRRDFRLRHELDHPRVRAEIEALTRYPNHLIAMHDRLELYLPNIYAAVRSRGMPAELALLPIIESSMNPHAEALNGPTGLWQIIPATGDRMKLPRNWWFDGRRDPALSTEAALDYLQYLYDRFGDWRLAIVSYNVGEGTVTRALGGRSGPVSFWSLRLPDHGMVFVPKLLALAAVVADPDRHGMPLPELRTGAAFTTIDTAGQIEIARAAEALRIDEETLYLLNPGLNRNATPPEGPHHLNVPPAVAERARTWIANLDQSDRIAWDRVQVARGDSLGAIAQRYGTDVRTLRQINNLPDDRIRAGQSLFVPRATARNGLVAATAAGTPSRAASTGPPTGAAGGHADAHVVRSGDTLWGIARAYRVSLERLLAANDLKRGQVLRIGQRLVIPGP